MKKIILVIVSLMFIQYSYSQEQKQEETEHERLRRVFKDWVKPGEVKGVYNEYSTDTISMMCVMSNKKTPKGASTVDKSDPTHKITLASTEILNNIFKKNLSPYIDFEALNGGESFYLFFNANISGKIEAVVFAYPYRLNIPVVVIEQIEKEIKKQCRLEFDRKSPAFIHANFVTYDCMVFLKECCL